MVDRDLRNTILKECVSRYGIISLLGGRSYGDDVEGSVAIQSRGKWRLFVPTIEYDSNSRKFQESVRTVGEYPEFIRLENALETDFDAETLEYDKWLSTLYPKTFNAKAENRSVETVKLLSAMGHTAMLSNLNDRIIFKSINHWFIGIPSPDDPAELETLGPFGSAEDAIFVSFRKEKRLRLEEDEKIT